MDNFRKGDCVDRKRVSMFDRWSEGYTVVEMPDDFVPLGDCVYVEKNGYNHRHSSSAFKTCGKPQE